MLLHVATKIGHNNPILCDKGESMRHITILLIIYAGYTLVVIAGAIAMIVKKNLKFLPELILLYLWRGVYLYFESRGHFNTPAFVFALVILTVLLHNLVGEFIDVYHKSTTFDRWLHLLGAFSYSLFIYSIIDHWLKPPGLPMLYVFLFVTCIGVTVGTLFEVLEFARDTATRKKPRLPAQHGLKDTDTDIIFNGIGAILAGVAAMFMYA